MTFWVEFFKDPYSDACKELYEFVPELREAKEVFEAAKSDPEKRRLLEEREDAIRNYAADMYQAREEGLVEGEAKGREEGKAEVARNLLVIGLSVEQISQATGLSIVEVKALIM